MDIELKFCKTKKSWGLVAQSVYVLTTTDMET